MSTTWKIPTGSDGSPHINVGANGATLTFTPSSPVPDEFAAVQEAVANNSIARISGEPAWKEFRRWQVTTGKLSRQLAATQAMERELVARRERLTIDKPDDLASQLIDIDDQLLTARSSAVRIGREIEVLGETMNKVQQAAHGLARNLTHRCKNEVARVFVERRGELLDKITKLIGEHLTELATCNIRVARAMEGTITDAVVNQLMQPE